MMLRDYIRSSRAGALVRKADEAARMRDGLKNYSKPTFREKWSEKWNEFRGKNWLLQVIDIIGTIIILPFLILLWTIAIISWVIILPFIPFILIGGFIVYMIPSVIIGGFIDLMRKIFVRDNQYEKWKYTDKMLGFWEFNLYGMSIQGYIDFKRKEKERKERNLATLTTQELLEYHGKLIEQGGTLYD
tara:strand:+ start:3348 stop:3911 length:564 start_codon:yes stop_codon:yes gene_type:complete